MPSSSLYERYKPETRKQLICPALVCIRDTNQKLENIKRDYSTKNAGSFDVPARILACLEQVMYSIYIQPDCKT